MDLSLRHRSDGLFGKNHLTVHVIWFFGKIVNITKIHLWELMALTCLYRYIMRFWTNISRCDVSRRWNSASAHNRTQCAKEQLLGTLSIFFSGQAEELKFISLSVRGIDLAFDCDSYHPQSFKSSHLRAKAVFACQYALLVCSRTSGGDIALDWWLLCHCEWLSQFVAFSNARGRSKCTAFATIFTCYRTQMLEDSSLGRSELKMGSRTNMSLGGQSVFLHYRQHKGPRSS